MFIFTHKNCNAYFKLFIVLLVAAHQSDPWIYTFKSRFNSQHPVLVTKSYGPVDSDSVTLPLKEMSLAYIFLSVFGS